MRRQRYEMGTRGHRREGRYHKKDEEGIKKESKTEGRMGSRNGSDGHE